MSAEAVYSLLSADSGVTSLVAGRIYPLILPQSPTYPCITYSIDGAKEGSTFGGQGTFQAIPVDVDAWAETYYEAAGIADAVSLALKNYRGVSVGIQIDTIMRESAVSVFEESVEKYRITTNFTMYRR